MKHLNVKIHVPISVLFLYKPLPVPFAFPGVLHIANLYSGVLHRQLGNALAELTQVPPSQFFCAELTDVILKHETVHSLDFRTTMGGQTPKTGALWRGRGDEIEHFLHYSPYPFSLGLKAVLDINKKTVRHALVHIAATADETAELPVKIFVQPLSDESHVPKAPPPPPSLS